MEWFNGSNKDFHFEIFSVSHFFIMTIFILIIIGIFLTRGKLKDEKWRSAEYIAALSLVLIEVAYHIWMYINGNWNASRSLPLQLCSISVMLSVILLITRKRLFFEILLFTALLGSAQAIFTPALTYDFPHFRFFHFFYTHMMVVWIALYFLWAKRLRPTIWSVLKLFIFLNILLPVILAINKLTGGNYLYLSQKPDSPSLMDVFGPYPWYIWSLEGVLIFLSLIVWLFFREKNQDVIEKHVEKSN